MSAYQGYTETEDRIQARLERINQASARIIQLSKIVADPAATMEDIQQAARNMSAEMEAVKKQEQAQARKVIYRAVLVATGWAAFTAFLIVAIAAALGV